MLVRDGLFKLFFLYFYFSSDEVQRRENNWKKKVAKRAESNEIDQLTYILHAATIINLRIYFSIFSLSHFFLLGMHDVRTFYFSAISHFTCNFIDHEELNMCFTNIITENFALSHCSHLMLLLMPQIVNFSFFNTQIFSHYSPHQDREN
jgi:hypothetical protein